MGSSNPLEEIVETIRLAAGADFAFVLTLLGRLVTSRAPSDMPEIGRAKLCEEAQELLGTDRVGLVSLPREELVPYGGAAPVDVYVALADDQAIVCIVMASWADQRVVGQALEAGIDEIEPFLAQASKKRGGKGKRGREQLKTLPDSRVATGRIRGKPPTMPPGPRAHLDTMPQYVGGKKRGAMAGLVNLTGTVATPSPAMIPSPTIKDAPRTLLVPRGSMPSIQVGEAAVGRETMVAIEADQRSAEGPPPGSALTSMPDVRVELLSIGRATEIDLRQEEAKRLQSFLDANQGDHVLGDHDPRLTQPWVEPATDAKRAADAATSGRKLPPKVTLKLEEADGEVLEAMLLDGIESPDGPRKPQQSLDVWHDAIEETMDDGERKKRG